jgi:uncharacterized membrane protein required for colicin V production
MRLLPCLLSFLQQSPEPETPSSSGSVPWLDFACLALLILCTLLGARRGMWWQFVRLLGLVATLSVTRAVAPRLSQGLVNLFSFTPEMANGILWSVFLVSGLCAVALVARMGGAMIEGGELSPGDRIGGAICGLCSGLLLATGVIICSSQLASQRWVDAHLRGSRAQGLVDGLAHVVPAALDPIAAGRVSSEVHAAEPQGH